LDKNRNRQKSVLTPGILQFVCALNFRKDLWVDLVIAVWISCSIPGVNTDFYRLRFLFKSVHVSRNFLIIFAIALFTGVCLLN
jgi:hypothetical protein